MTDLPPRTLFVLDIIARAAAAGEETPRNEAMEAALRAAGFRLYAAADGRHRHSGNVVSYEIGRLVQAGRIALHGGKRLRVFEMCATGQRTVPRAETMLAIKRQQVDARIREATAGWPRPTRISVAAYDASLRRGPPIRIQGPKAGAETWTHLGVRSAAPAQSLTGCSAALAAEAV
ncbi:hypothetical protein FFK22_008905 [Mycobacterium sp. KBS0706]|uniref:hypothetical protein n=1 Tax=Mycobacterium sp. KBS0706 TaxID=2578109 RepID=UPI00110F7CFD|nr:hypothetical protein [Mycobacterium sp. KBS0706]TSD89090.1 hypothetical protein FFK22_008905 [Mycobacterium sp. KBS0706]